MLIFNNLSSESQDVTVDLSQYTGVAPIDVLTGKRLPEISKTPYSLKLVGYDYKWLRL
jgi:maltose alpha-D-glucosyltransferase/alpha-amylase